VTEQNLSVKSFQLPSSFVRRAHKLWLKPEQVYSIFLKVWGRKRPHNSIAFTQAGEQHNFSLCNFLHLPLSFIPIRSNKTAPTVVVKSKVVPVP